MNISEQIIYYIKKVLHSLCIDIHNRDFANLWWGNNWMTLVVDDTKSCNYDLVGELGSGVEGGEEGR